MKSFWDNLPKPFFVLAPMADVTDPAYRALIAESGKPDVTWTEFVSADGIFHTREKGIMPDSENPLLRDLQYTEAERPIVAQLFSSNPANIAYTAKLCAELGFDGVDINMGCPDKSIEKQGCGAAMMKDPEKARAIIRAAKESGLPVSVKTRIGYNTETMDEWLTQVLEEKPAALTVHLRTRKEMSKVPAHWELMPKAVAIRDRISPDTYILGNGDVQDIADARQKVLDSGADGVMLGRAIFGNPWLFSSLNRNGRLTKSSIPCREDKVQALLALACGYEKLRPRKSFHILKKHVKAFIIGFDDSAPLRGKLMEAVDFADFIQILETAS